MLCGHFDILNIVTLITKDCKSLSPLFCSLRCVVKTDFLRQNDSSLLCTFVFDYTTLWNISIVFNFMEFNLCGSQN